MQFEIRSDIIIVLIAGTMLLIFLVGFIISFLRFYHKKKVIYHKNLVLIKSQFQQTLLQTQLEIQEQTLKTISQEVHDNIGQVLSLAKLNINTMNCNEPQALQEKINDSKHLISKAIQDLRDLSRSLNTDYVNELGLARAIEYELEMIKKTGSYETQLNIEGKPFRLEPQQELIIFRIVQEALHNIIKHAQATLINVQLNFYADTFILTIKDNGAGFDATELQKNNYTGLGLGLRNMYNRAKLINTNFNLTSTLQKGTAITLSLPLSTNKP